ncbi:MAG: class I SAM-dependent methyltransferase [Acidimicrobiales bacterium]
MTGWGLVWAAFAAILIANAFRLRMRLGGLEVLGGLDHQRDIDPDQDDAYQFICARGVHVDPATRTAAISHARAAGLQVLDLVPRDLPMTQAMDLARLISAKTYRKNRFAAGRGAFQAICAHGDVLRRAGLEPREDLDPVEMVEATKTLKRYASLAMDIAVAPELPASKLDPAQRRAYLKALFGVATDIGLGVVLVEWAVITAGLAVSTLWGSVALAAFSIQPLLALSWGPLRPKHLVLMTPFRLILELWLWLRTLGGTWRPAASQRRDQSEALRAIYDTLLAEGTQRFFEPRRSSCPLCGGEELSVHLRTTDLLQHKPGRFTLERCRGCKHIFQNPRLSIEGLDFCYRDFYDGLFGEQAEFVFGASETSYRGRAEMPKGLFAPERWLDVGAGHGHFCATARDTWPEAIFDGLDMSESIEEAHRRGWVDSYYRGLFPDIAPTIAASYDVVSMHHYLEHTRDPEAELDAALAVLVPQGHLLVEVPDPESVLGRVIGKYWIAWFQPQHQNFISLANLTQLLVKRGFDVEKVERGSTHQSVDFLIATWLLTGRLAPPAGLPWLPPRTALQRARRIAVWPLMLPAFAVALAADALIGAFIHHNKSIESHASNTFRILARAPIARSQAS